MSDDIKKSNVLEGGKSIGRREFLVKSAAVGATVFGMPWIGSRGTLASVREGAQDKPNILVIIVDEMRQPQWFPRYEQLDTLLPSIARIRKGGVEFRGHYAAATACTASRASLLTGLYAHQNGIMLNQNAKTPWLDPGFKTWGSGLRDLGYNTSWYGKWHLSGGDSLEPYGFDGGTYPSPNGGAQVGTSRDSGTVDQFAAWFESNAIKGPWATTVSLLNPHDIMYYPEFTEHYLHDHLASTTLSAVPPNFETTEQLIENKPSLQAAHQQESDERYGDMPTTGENWQQSYVDYLNAYLIYQTLADRQIARVLDTLDSQPAVRDNTVVVFFSDHGEFGGSHGLRAKGNAVYEESIHVPLIVNDPTGRWTKHTNLPRTQLTSIVDIFGLLLTVGSGSNSWQGSPEYSHLSNRLDLTSILGNARAPGRDYVLHTSDSPPSTHPVPTHVIGYRTASAKLGTYSYWKPETGEIQLQGQETELYDYHSPGGRTELDNVNKTKPELFAELNDELTQNAIPNELRSPPGKYADLSSRAMQTYYDYVADLDGSGDS